MELRFEDLVVDPEPVLRRIARFVDLPWDDAMLHYHRQAEERMSREMARTLKPWGAARSPPRSAPPARARQPPTKPEPGRSLATEMSPRTGRRSSRSPARC